jgi:imidazoleglycerol-phosphate dehydratase
VTRRAEIARRTAETNVTLALALDGTGAGARRTGVGFLDHMLDLLARHGRLDLDVGVEGDLQTGAHHTVEDTGIVLGQALDQALGDRAGITRYGHAVVPMDDAQASAAVDLGGRPFAELKLELDPGMAEHMLQSLAQAARANIHVEATGRDAHHVAEAAFKAVGRALGAAVAPAGAGVPSTKGRL